MDQVNEIRAQTLGTFQGRLKFPLRISQRKLLLISVDLFLINAALLLGLSLSIIAPSRFAPVAPDIIWFAATSLVWLAIASANDNYVIKRAAKVYTGVGGIIKSTLLLGIVIAGIALLFPAMLRKWPHILLFFVLVIGLLSLWRICYAKVLGRPNFKRRGLIVGTGQAGQEIIRIIAEHDPSYDVIGYVAGDSPPGEQSIRGIARVDSWSTLAQYVEDHDVSDIILTMPGEVQAQHQHAILSCFEKGVRIVPMSELYEEITGRIPVEHIGERWSFSLPIDWDSRGLYLLVKRSLDVAIASVGLIMLLPLFPFLALAIKLDSPGGVFYRPVRQGQGGKPIRLWKFRTMVANADRIGDPTFTSKSDHRITRTGRLLRLTHVDELPQFLNVITGDMSLVGPRPERHVPELEAAIPYYRARNAVKPGATGWALVNQGYAEGVEETLIKLQYDLYYIKHQSLTLDILILCKSVIHMLTMGGQ